MSWGRKIGGTVLLALVVLAFAFAGNTGTDMGMRLQEPSLAHPFGTDSFGRDLLSRVSSGFLVSVMLSSAVTLSATLGGILLSLLMVRSSLIGTMSRGVGDILKSLPSIMLALFFVSLFGQNVFILYLALTLAQIPNIARTSQSRILVLQNEEYMTALKALGIRRSRIVLCHYVPHIYPEIANQSIGIFSTTILTESSLSFLGCGLPPTFPTLGAIMAEGRSFLFTSPFLFAIPAAVLFLAGLSLYLIQDSSRA